MKKGILLVIVLGMLGWAIFDYISSSDDTAGNDEMESASMPSETTEEGTSSDEVGLEKGKLAPDFEVTTLDGEHVKLSDYRGERVMLNFWATWCPPCRAEMPDMQKVYEKENVTILAVNMIETESNEEDVADFVKSYELTFPILIDENSNIMMDYRIQAYPTSYLIDSSGRIQFINLGAMNHDQMIQQFNRME